ncbi:Protein of unknown function [Lactobacillus helveticus CIRM-BIA 953]|uniref:Uncharacterized protein n=1 Tax=Lactobacillus helveticus CIRM-BIA 953 TaxID=1226335 RepID=U4QBV2_LACHE|nr:Protein of unknown function [Lactobacillus helveticus CIRM-BIA 953]
MKDTEFLEKLKTSVKKEQVEYGISLLSVSCNNTNKMTDH